MSRTPVSGSISISATWAPLGHAAAVDRSPRDSSGCGASPLWRLISSRMDIDSLPPWRRKMPSAKVISSGATSN